MDLELALAVIVIERFVHHQDALDGIGQDERIVVVAALRDDGGDFGCGGDRAALASVVGRLQSRHRLGWACSGERAEEEQDEEASRLTTIE